MEQINCMTPCHETHSSRHRINNKSIQEEHKIWALPLEACGYVVQFRPYHATKKGKQVASSTKWRLRENVVLRSMERVTPTFSSDIFRDNYFWKDNYLFVCLPTLELTTFQWEVCSTKIGYANARSLRTNSCKKKKVVTLKSTHQAREQCNFDKNGSRAVYIDFYESCKPKRFVRCWNKVERKYI